MANMQLLSLLKTRVKVWNNWQRRHANARPDLRNADLSNTNLSFVHLQRADLHSTNLSQSILCNANLRYADLSHADLRAANLGHADLSHANLTDADLSSANLHHANLNETLFRATNLTNINLSHSLLRNTTFANVDLRSVRGLDTAYYFAPSTVGIDTLSRSKGMLPDVFLRNANAHENLVAFIRERGEVPFDYYKTFISYASEDEKFVQQLHHDLQQAGVWCWFAPASLGGGDYFKARIDDAIRQCEKILIIFSQHALASEWVRYEVEFTRQQERKRKISMIVPLRLDAAIINDPGWAAFLQGKRHISDFACWNQPRSYQNALKLILRDLQILGE